jgi:catechol 2,3-dioxygenase
MQTDFPFPPLPDRAQRPTGLNHVVLNVRDIEESHRFWTEILGFTQVGALRPTQSRKRPQMRFYSGDHDGQLQHHDIALVEVRGSTADTEPGATGLNHVAIAMPDREAWLKQLAFLRSRGINFAARFYRGVSRSVHVTDPNGHDVEIMYELPREIWDRDIDAALNYVEVLPGEAEEPLVDDRLPPVFGGSEQRSL